MAVWVPRLPTDSGSISLEGTDMPAGKK